MVVLSYLTWRDFDPGALSRAGLIQENEVRLGSGIFVAGNRGSAALEPGPGPRGLLGNPRQTEISGV